MIRLSMTEEQAAVLRDALDLYARLGLGQVDVVTQMVICGTALPADGHLASIDQVDAVRDGMSMVRHALGFRGEGHSRGIGADDVPVAIATAWDLKKVVAKAVAVAREPNPEPGARGVDYDGLFVSFSPAPHPVAEIVDGEPGMEPSAGPAP